MSIIIQEKLGGVMVRPKSILVTGGAGFLGSHLCERLLNERHRVICLDSFDTGHFRNIEHLISRPGFELVRHDVALPFSFAVDEIYNLACPASPKHYQLDPIQTTRTSVLGALNALELACRLSCRIFQASTSEVYGDPLMHPQREDYCGNVNPIGPRACYDEGKRCAETIFFDYHRRHRTKIKVARIFNTYGPRMHPDDGRVVSNFITQALQGNPITIYGNGKQTRSFCYVDDMVDGFVRFMESPPELTGPINLGNPVEFTIEELADAVIEMTGSRSRIVYQELPQDDPQQRKPDVSAARMHLDWQPRTGLRAGLQAAIEYFEGVLGSGAMTSASARIA